MDNSNTYGWNQCDEEDYDSGTPPEEQMATEPIQVEEEQAGTLIGAHEQSEVVDLQKLEDDPVADWQATLANGRVVWFWIDEEDNSVHIASRR